MGGSENRQRFNLATMSGVFPGTRTMVYQRVRLAERGNASSRTALGAAALVR